MQVSHTLSQVSAVFDDPNLVSCCGLAPVVALAKRCGLAELAANKLTLTSTGDQHAHLKVPVLIAGMAAGADSIDDMDLLRAWCSGTGSGAKFAAGRPVVSGDQ